MTKLIHEPFLVTIYMDESDARSRDLTTFTSDEERCSALVGKDRMCNLMAVAELCFYVEVNGVQVAHFVDVCGEHREKLMPTGTQMEIA